MQRLSCGCAHAARGVLVTPEDLHSAMAASGAVSVPVACPIER
jgi:hypothetical protein